MPKERGAVELELEQLKMDHADLLTLLEAFQTAIAERDECRLAVPVAVARLRKAKEELKRADQKVADLSIRVRHARGKKSP